MKNKFSLKGEIRTKTEDEIGQDIVGGILGYVNDR